MVVQCRRIHVENSLERGDCAQSVVLCVQHVGDIQASVVALVNVQDVKESPTRQPTNQLLPGFLNKCLELRLDRLSAEYYTPRGLK